MRFNFLKSILRPPWHWLNKNIYASKFNKRARELKRIFKHRFQLSQAVLTEGNPDLVWAQLQSTIPTIGYKTVNLPNAKFDDYMSRYGVHYKTIGNPIEKALEHSLTFDLIDFSKVKRYCDMASAHSPIRSAFENDFPQVEFWKQDLEYLTDLNKKIIGGYAQNLSDVPDGFFDAVGLHCSFEHFMGSSDQEFIVELNRILSPNGVCVILPFYLDLDAKIYFDPTLVSTKDINAFDSEASLCAAFNFRQAHGRYYSPVTFLDRIVRNCPENLKLTVVRFTNQMSVSSTIYLAHALVAHRNESVFHAN